jgi:hypothetical protein
MAKRQRANTLCRALSSTESRERPASLVELIATLSLVLSTAVAATAVSIGIARAEVFTLRADDVSASLMIGVLIGVLLLAMTGLTAAIMDDPKGRE